MSSRDTSHLSLDESLKKSQDPLESNKQDGNNLTSWGSKSSLNLNGKKDDNIRKIAANIAKNVRNELSSKPVPKGKYMEVQAASSSSQEKNERLTLKETSSLLGKSREQLKQETRVKIKSVIVSCSSCILTILNELDGS